MADWKDVLKAVAPALGTALGGPAAGMAVKVLGDTLLGKPDATEEDISSAVIAGALTPDVILKLKEQELNFKLEIQKLALEDKKADLLNEQSYLEDRQNARNNNAQNHDVFSLGVGILIIYAIVLISGLYGSFEIITGGIILKDAATVGIVSTFIGGILGTVGTMATQVISFYFGSSKGSEKKTDQLADAFRSIK